MVEMRWVIKHEWDRPKLQMRTEHLYMNNIAGGYTWSEWSDVPTVTIPDAVNHEVKNQLIPALRDDPSIGDKLRALRQQAIDEGMELISTDQILEQKRLIRGG